MFFLIPVGHDQPVYTQPVITYALIALCSLIYLWSYEADRRWEERAGYALRYVSSYLESYPEATIDSAQFEELPGLVPVQLRIALKLRSVEKDEELDEDLELLVYDLIDALNAGPFASRFGYTPGQPSILKAFSSLFVHGGFFHLLGNMLFLFLAGTVIECFWGGGRFVAFYLLAGLGAVGAHHLSAPESMIPLIGASGAISALLGAFLIGHHRSRIRMFFLLIWLRIVIKLFYLPAWVVLPGWALLQLFSLITAPQDGGGVAYSAQVGGFLIGLLAAGLARQFNWAARDGGSY